MLLGVVKLVGGQDGDWEALHWEFGVGAALWFAASEVGWGV
jgi:hypothetical protein